MTQLHSLLKLCVGLLNIQTTLGLPTSLNTTTLESRDVPADDISIYSLDVSPILPPETT